VVEWSEFTYRVSDLILTSAAVSRLFSFAGWYLGNPAMT